MQRVRILSLISLVLALSAPLAAVCASQSQQSMGVATHFVTDSSRPNWTDSRSRPVLMHVFYPTDQAPEALTFGPGNQAFFLVGSGRRNAPVKAVQEGKQPLAILSHGTGSGAEQMGWIAQALVAEGYIVVGLNHHGNSFVESYLPQGFMHTWERAADVSFAIDWALDESPYKSLIDPSKVVVVGFSIGAYTALATAGAITNRDYFTNQFCESSQRDATCDPQREFPNVKEVYATLAKDEKVGASLLRESHSYLDSRIKAVVAIAPPAHLFSPDSLHFNTLPTLIIVGEQDAITPKDTNALYLAERFSDSKTVVIPLAGHFSFVSQCFPAGEQAMPHLCTEVNSADRMSIHQVSTEAIREFLKEKL